MSRHEDLLAKAEYLANLSDCRWKHGAVIARGSTVLATATNRFRNDSRIDYEGSTFHAEEAALRALCRTTGDTYGQASFKGLIIYVARVNNQGTSRLSRPCMNCMKLLANAKIKDVVYTNGLPDYLSHEKIGVSP